MNHLSQTDTKKWWSECRRLCGMDKSAADIATKCLVGSIPTHENKLLLANNINEGFLEPLHGFEPLTPGFCVDTTGFSVPLVSVAAVEKCLNSVSISKAGRPDNIPNWVLRDYSFELASPLCDIINSSWSEGTLPAIWKYADVTPLPKVIQSQRYQN